LTVTVQSFHVTGTKLNEIQRTLGMTAKLWGHGRRPEQWARDPVFQQLEDLWAQLDKPPNSRVVDEICIAADNLDVSGELRNYRRNLFKKIDKLTREPRPQSELAKKRI
jgi:hypothetical protein